MNWVTFFTQTGSEIYNIIKQIGIVPKKIITNKKKNLFSKINPYLLSEYGYLIHKIPSKPSVDDYLKSLEGINKDDIITLHGYLRIIPSNICDKYMVYNGHPGLITKTKELIGLNPQKKAFNMRLKTSGSVIHKVIPDVDSGEVVMSKEVSIDGLTLDQVYEVLHKNSTDLWIQFLKEIVT
jgi:folate-dependent phosphoribosylglycinamide formyltransferase PurN